jgi:hypothetical protein
MLMWQLTMSEPVMDAQLSFRKSTRQSAQGFTAAGCHRQTPANAHDFQLAMAHLLVSSPILQFTQLRDPDKTPVTSDMQVQRRS